MALPWSRWRSSRPAAAAGGSKAFTLSDAKRLVGVRPSAAGWTWPSTANESTVQAEAAWSEWEDGNKLAHVDVRLYRSAPAAHDAMAAFNALSRRYARQGGYILGEEGVSDLGDDAWLLRIGGNSPQVTYHWRRRNLVLEAHMHCFGVCPADFAAAAHAWAGQSTPKHAATNRRRSRPRSPTSYC